MSISEGRFSEQKTDTADTQRRNTYGRIKKNRQYNAVSYIPSLLLHTTYTSSRMHNYWHKSVLLKMTVIFIHPAVEPEISPSSIKLWHPVPNLTR
jgi:hypothetical protein